MTAPVRPAGFPEPFFETPESAALRRSSPLRTDVAKSRSTFSTFAAALGSRKIALCLAISEFTPVLTHLSYTSSAYANDGKKTTTPPGATRHALARSLPSSSIISGALLEPKE